MKNAVICLAGCALASISHTQAVEPVIVEPGPHHAIVERGPHHAIWQSVTERVTPYGRTFYLTNSYREIATGKHYIKDGQYFPSVADISILASGFGVATQMQHKVIFAPNANTLGAVDCLTSDDKRLRSHVLGLAYTDKTTGRGVMIASVRDSTAVLIANNQVLYADAFDTEGGFRADIRYTVTIGGLEQDIILVQSPPDPATYGIDPRNCRLEVYSEFVEAVQPSKEIVVLSRESDAQARQRMVEPDLVDETLIFGEMRMSQGSAFSFVQNAEEAAVPMGKTWEQRENRQLLIERADFSALEAELSRLPKVAQVRDPKKSLPLRGADQKAWANFLPVRPPKAHAAARKLRTKEMAQLSLPREGLVLDYQLLIDQTNFTFFGDETYYASGQVTLSGTTVLEAGTVIKCTNGATVKRIWVKGPLDCRTTAWRPATFTAKDDDTIGQTISGSTGSPSGNYYGQMFDMTGNTNSIDLHDVHFRYGHYAVNLGSIGSPVLTLSHAQFTRNWAAVVNNVGEAKLRNVLIHDGTYATGSGGTYRCENLTAHALQYFRSIGYTNAYLTNCLLIAVTNNVLFSGSNNQTNSDAGVFQTAGWGSHYLASNSAYRNAGTTNINPSLLASLRQMTTYPPLVLTNDITVNTTLTPQAQRDTNDVDIGFHYSPTDWLVGGISVTGATLTVSGGATVAIDAANTNWGIRLQSGSALISNGDPVYLNRFVRTHCVQEIPAGSGSSTVPLFADTYPAPTSPVTLNLRFTDVPQIQRYSAFYQMNACGTFGTIILRDSQFAGGTNYISQSLSNQLMAITNVLVENSSWRFYPYPPNTFHLRNGTFKSGYLDLYVPAGANWTVKDCIFDYTTVTNMGAGTLTNDYNGYLTNAVKFASSGAHDVVLATNTVNFQTGPLGSYYLLTNSAFVDAGSLTNAADRGFYWYTSFTNQTVEANTPLNLGFHYMGLTNGVPIDVDGDGVPFWADGDPNNPGIGYLMITIESPVDGSTIQ